MRMVLRASCHLATYAESPVPVAGACMRAVQVRAQANLRQQAVCEWRGSLLRAESFPKGGLGSGAELAQGGLT